MNKTAFVEALRNAVADGTVSAEEMSQLGKMMAEFGLTDKDVARARVEAYHRAFAVAKADGAISEREVENVHQLENYLRISDADIAPTQRELARLRLLTEIKAGNLPHVGVPTGVVLQKTEIVYWFEPSALMEERVVRRRYEGGSSGVSFRIAKGVSYRVGAHRGHVVPETATVPISEGQLVITNKRVVFHGNRKSFALKYDKLIGMELFEDGLSLSAATGKAKLVRFSDKSNSDIVGAVLTQAVNGAA